MTLSIPEDLHQLIKEHNEVRWSEIARRAMWDYAKKLELLDKLTENSELTEVDVKDNKKDYITKQKLKKDK